MIQKWLPHDMDKADITAAVNNSVSKVAIFDYDEMMERLMDDTILAEKITSIFIDIMPKQINTLKQAVLAGDSKNAELNGIT